MSSSSPYSSISFSGSDADQIGPFPPQEPSRQRPSQPLRRSSPRLFRDFFDAMSDTASRRQVALPRPVLSHQDPLHNVNRALENANRALQDAQEAFQQARRLRTESEARRLRADSEAPNQFVDLTRTSSPPPPGLDRSSSAESHYISRTTHPHDSSSTHRSRRFNTLDEPVYGLRRNHDLPHPRANVRFWPLRPFNPAIARTPRGYPLGVGQLPSAVEEEAISRQRENHSNWERTQARNRERQRNQEQDQNQHQTENPSPNTTMSPPSSSSSRPTTQSSRRRTSTPHYETGEDDPSIDEVDLTAVDDPKSLSIALAKQREDAILSQNPGTEAGRTILTAYKCPVCMDTPTDATSTACGHVFCHRCIVDTLNWSMEQRREDAPANRKVKGVCPVCRKLLDLKDTPGTGRSLIPLELKLMVKKRKREEESGNDKEKDKGKGKSLVKAETLSDDEENGNDKENSGRPEKRERESTEDEIWRAFVDDNA